MSVLTPDTPDISPFNIDTDGFNLHLSKKQQVAASVLGGLSAAGVSSAAFATAAGGSAGSGAAASIQEGVANSIAMINSIDGIALAAFGVALAPMGFMLTLRVLNMVLSRV